MSDRWRAETVPGGFWRPCAVPGGTPHGCYGTGGAFCGSIGGGGWLPLRGGRPRAPGGRPPPPRAFPPPAPAPRPPAGRRPAPGRGGRRGGPAGGRGAVLGGGVVGGGAGGAVRAMGQGPGEADPGYDLPAASSLSDADSFLQVKPFLRLLAGLCGQIRPVPLPGVAAVCLPAPGTPGGDRTATRLRPFAAGPWRDRPSHRLRDPLQDGTAPPPAAPTLRAPQGSRREA